MSSDASARRLLRRVCDRKVPVGFIILGATLLVLACISWWAVSALLTAQDRVEHTYDVITALEAGLGLLADVETSQRGFLLTGDRRFAEESVVGQKRLEGWISATRDLTHDNPRQQERLRELEPLIRQRVAVLNAGMRLREEKGTQAIADPAAFREGKQLMQRIWKKILEMRGDEDQLLARRQSAAGTRARASLMAVGICCIVAVITGLVAMGAIRRDLRRREAIETELRATKGSLEARVQERMAELHTANETLRSNERRFRALIEQGSDSIALIDAHNRILYLSPAVKAVEGYSPEELVGRSGLENTHPDDLPAVEKVVGELLKSPGRPVPVVWRRRHKDGRWLWLEGVATNLLDDPAVQAIVTNYRDITDRKAAEDRAAWLLSFLERNPNPIVEIDLAADRVRYVNPTARQLFPGLEADGRSHPFLAGLNEFAVNGVKRPEQIVGREVAVGEQWYSQRLHHIAAERCLRIFSTDISERRRAEEELRVVNRDLEQRVHERTLELEQANHELDRQRNRLQRLFESLPGLYLVLTPEFEIVGASNAYLAATMTQRETIIGRNLFEVFPDNPEDPAACGVNNLRHSLDRVLRTAATDTMAIQKYDVRRPDGVFEERYWSPVNAPLLNESGSVEYIVHRVEDVTEFVRRREKEQGAGEGQGAMRDRMERMEADIFRSSQAVQSANQQLRALNEELEAFSYSVSHDLRAPLRHINGYLELLARQVGESWDEKARRYFAIVLDSSTQMGQLIDDLLAFSRMGRVDMLETDVDLNTLAKEVTARLRAETTARRIDWITGPLPTVRGDASMLRQVFVNLLANAVKYSRGRDPARIEISAQSQGPDEVVISVRDNGAGFDMKYAKKLFGVFQRMHRIEEFEGTGVGLANVRRIINRHGGRTWATAAPGEGATFYFSLTPARDRKEPSALANHVSGSEHRTADF